LQRFVAEGVKTVQELLHSGFSPHSIYCTDEVLFQDHSEVLRRISPADLDRMSALKSPNKVLAVFDIPGPEKISLDQWILVLDGVQDPGNLGTIIRLCDWYGIRNIICSENSVDCYNPKVVQATMGSIARVRVHYHDLESWLKDYPYNVFGAVMDGTNMYTLQLPSKGVLLMGSESHGISKEIEPLIHSRITLPQFGQPSAESLNVAMATAICLSEIRRTDLLTQR
jgi:TrmH family RNA methyltransferase